MEEDREVDMGKYALGLDFGTLDMRAVLVNIKNGEGAIK